MMKYEAPKFEVLELVADVITTSGDEGIWTPPSEED